MNLEKELEEKYNWKVECRDNFNYQINKYRPERRGTKIILHPDWYEDIHSIREASNSYQKAILDEYKAKIELHNSKNPIFKW